MLRRSAFVRARMEGWHSQWHLHPAENVPRRDRQETERQVTVRPSQNTPLPVFVGSHSRRCSEQQYRTYLGVSALRRSTFAAMSHVSHVMARPSAVPFYLCLVR
jgi:hypothetical protein